MKQETQSANCPYCLSPIGEAEESTRCPICGVLHHAECWRANGKCSVYGCDGWQAWSNAINEKIAPRIADKIDVDVRGAERRAVQDNPLCIECGRPVHQGELECRKCRRRNRPGMFEGCLGPSVVALCGILGLAVALRIG